MSSCDLKLAVWDDRGQLLREEEARRRRATWRSRPVVSAIPARPGLVGSLPPSTTSNYPLDRAGVAAGQLAAVAPARGTRPRSQARAVTRSRFLGSQTVVFTTLEPPLSTVRTEFP
jgi:hypothetical protein